jgi:hypothetical protein
MGLVEWLDILSLSSLGDASIVNAVAWSGGSTRPARPAAERCSLASPEPDWRHGRAQLTSKPDCPRGRAYRQGPAAAAAARRTSGQQPVVLRREDDWLDYRYFLSPVPGPNRDRGPARQCAR